MAKSLSDRISDRMAKRKPNKRALNLAAFLANKSDIEDALNNLWSVRSIWETLNHEGRINVSYQAFNNYVNKHIERNNKRNKRAGSVVVKIESNEQKEKSEIKKLEIKKSEFVFNSTPNKEDLI